MPDELRWKFHPKTILAPYPHLPPSMEKLTSMKPVPSVKKVGDYCSILLSGDYKIIHVYLQIEKRILSVLNTKKINASDDGYDNNYSDLIMTHCIHVLEYHAVLNKHVQL